MELLEGLKQNNINHYCQRISKRKKKERKKDGKPTRIMQHSTAFKTTKTTTGKVI